MQEWEHVQVAHGRRHVDGKCLRNHYELAWCKLSMACPQLRMWQSHTQVSHLADVVHEELMGGIPVM